MPPPWCGAGASPGASNSGRTIPMRRSPPLRSRLRRAEGRLGVGGSAEERGGPGRTLPHRRPGRGMSRPKGGWIRGGARLRHGEGSGRRRGAIGARNERVAPAGGPATAPRITSARATARPVLPERGTSGGRTGRAGAVGCGGGRTSSEGEVAHGCCAGGRWIDKNRRREGVGGPISGNSSYRPLGAKEFGLLEHELRGGLLEVRGITELVQDALHQDANPGARTLA